MGFSGDGIRPPPISCSRTVWTTWSQARFEGLVASGYELRLVDVYREGGEFRYAGLFERDGRGVQWQAYHGMSADEHQARVIDLTVTGWRPVSVPVASHGGQRVYAGLHWQLDIGPFEQRSQIELHEYQSFFDRNVEAGCGWPT